MPETKAVLWRLGWYGLWAGNLVWITSVWAQNRLDDVQAGGGAALIALGALCGLFGAFFLLIQLILMSGIRPLERPFGLNRLIDMHHTNGFVGYTLIMTHVCLIVFGYSTLTGDGLIQQYFVLQQLPYITLASFAIWALNAVVISSIVIVRRRLRYEWWRTVHWLVYAVVILSFWHQVNNGHELLGSTVFRYYWWLLYTFALLSVIFMRWLHPLLLHARYGFRVERVERETPNVTSIYVSGKNLDQLKYEAGQFNFWYFWSPGLRLQKHPFTISSSPDDPYLRLSAKAIGDYSAALADVKPGTPALVNGPFGRFTMAMSTGRKRLFIAGGIGVTPIRSMLGDKVMGGDILLYSAQRETDLAFREYFVTLTDKGLAVHYLLEKLRQKQSNYHKGRITPELLVRLVPDLAERDVWLCGPPAMMSAVRQTLTGLGVPNHRIYSEEFRL